MINHFYETMARMDYLIEIFWFYNILSYFLAFKHCLRVAASAKQGRAAFLKT
jgi:hypothetical protein